MLGCLKTGELIRLSLHFGFLEQIKSKRFHKHLKYLELKSILYSERSGFHGNKILHLQKMSLSIDPRTQIFEFSCSFLLIWSTQQELIIVFSCFPLSRFSKHYNSQAIQNYFFRKKRRNTFRIDMQWDIQPIWGVVSMTLVFPNFLLKVKFNINQDKFKVFNANFSRMDQLQRKKITAYQ